MRSIFGFKMNNLTNKNTVGHSRASHVSFGRGYADSTSIETLSNKMSAESFWQKQPQICRNVQEERSILILWNVMMFGVENLSESWRTGPALLINCWVMYFEVVRKTLVIFHVFKGLQSWIFDDCNSNMPNDHSKTAFWFINSFRPLMEMPNVKYCKTNVYI